MQPQKPDWATRLIPAGVLMILIAACVLFSRAPQIPTGHTLGTSDEFDEISAMNPKVRIWISRDGLFVWNHERPTPLAELPRRIADYKRVKDRVGTAEVSSQALARFDEVVRVVAELRTAGFSYVTVSTRPREDPDDDPWR